MMIINKPVMPVEFALIKMNKVNRLQLEIRIPSQFPLWFIT